MNLTSTALVLLALTASPASAQSSFSAEDFEHQVQSYGPEQREGVPDDRYAMANTILESVRSRTRGRGGVFDVVDYWNLTTAFLMLNEPAGAVRLSFSKAVADHPATVCAYLGSAEPRALQRAIPDMVMPFQAYCASTPADEAFDPSRYAAERRLDPEIVSRIWRIHSEDQHARTSSGADWEQQQARDLANQRAILDLYREHGTYIGKSLVGEELAAVMWAVIQHSNVEMMQTFLPVVQTAVAHGELPPTPFKMLIDRLHAEQQGNQIFGSQDGVPLADHATRAAVAAQYGLNL